METTFDPGAGSIQGLTPARAGTGRAARQPAAARRERLRALVERKGFVSVAAIAVELGVSEMTIRRDLGRLESQGLVIRTHGGAVVPEGKRAPVIDIDEPAFEKRDRRGAAAKAAIAEAAARMVAPGQTIGLDVGTSVYRVARALADHGALKIFTNSLRAAMLLGNTAHQIYLPGGQLRGGEMSVCGSIAVSQLRNYWLDQVFIGVSGITEGGCFDYSLEDTEVKQVYIERASRVIVLCDSSKFGRMSVVRVCDFGAVDVLITEAAPPPDLARALARAEVRVVVAGDEGAERAARPGP